MLPLSYPVVVDDQTMKHNLAASSSMVVPPLMHKDLHEQEHKDLDVHVHEKEAHASWIP